MSSCLFTDTLAVFRLALTAELVQTVQPRYVQANEVERANRYRQPADKHRFMYARHLLRLLLGRYSGQAPDTIQLTIGARGKPNFAHTDAWHFNLSHAGDWILMAISTARVGMDIEWINPQFAFESLLPTSFSPSAQRHIQSDADPLAAFYQLWSRKEALVKATSKGIDDDFLQIPSLTGSHTLDSEVVGATGDWQVVSFPVAADYVASVAYADASMKPKFYTVDRGFLAHFTS